MKRIFLLLLIVFVSTATSFACTCIEIKESIRKKIEQAYSQSDIIFTGKVLSKEIKTHDEYTSSRDPIIYTVEIINLIKGEYKTGTIEVVSERSGASCGYLFELGKSYLIYSTESTHFSDLTKNPSDIYTGLCSGNQELRRTRKMELRILKRLSDKTK